MWTDNEDRFVMRLGVKDKRDGRYFHGSKRLFGSGMWADPELTASYEQDVNVQGDVMLLDKQEAALYALGS